MVDVFEEVEEQLRSDRYKTLALKTLPWVSGALLLALVGGGGWYGWQKHQEGVAAKASEGYQRGLADLGKNDPGRAFVEFDEVAKSGTPAYKSLALQQQGGIRLQQGKTAEAVQLFDAAAKVSPDLLFGDLARLKSAFALMDTASYGDIEARLKPLTEEKHPYRAQAREALAMAKLGADKTAEARADFQVLTIAPDASEGVRGRAQAATALIDSGSAKSLPEIVKAAQALPPAAALPPGLAVPGGAPPAAQPAAPAGGAQ